MPSNVLTGASVASFKGIELHRYLVSFTDSRGPRVVTHEFPKLDGARVEVMGRRPHKTEWQLTFTGPNWIKTLKQLVASIDADPSGLLVHPIYGQMQVVCQGFDRASVNIPEATDTISVPLVFIGDTPALDSAAAAQGVGALQQNVTSAVADLQTAAAPYNAPSTAAAVLTISNAANSYATAAAASAQGPIDASLDSQLGSVALSTEAVILAISSDPVGVGTAAIYDALAAAEVVYAACQDLADAVIAARPPIIEFIVPGPTSIAVLAAQRYGSKAIGRIDEILSLNVIPTPTAIPAGTKLILPSV